MWRTATVAFVAMLLALSAGAALAVDPIKCPAPAGGGSDPSYELNNYDCVGTPDNDTMNGTSGSDDMVGLAGDDTLNGSGGTDKIDALNNTYLDDTGTLIGEKGEDTVSGGPGNDTIAANDGVFDHIECGTGSRDIAYSDKKDEVTSDCEWRASYDTPRHCSGPDGPPWTEPEHPGRDPGNWPEGIAWVGEKIIWCIDGTGRDNKNLVGKSNKKRDSDLLDSIWADKGDDTLKGGVGPDFLEGWSGNDILEGGAGTDFLYGDSSDNPAFEDFFKGAGEDEISGGPGDDFIGAIDNKIDTISCGGGHDVVQRDEEGVAGSTVTDEVADDCENISPEAEDAQLVCRLFGRRR
jgi:Ca2+-binding RTX toxin-like protein